MPDWPTAALIITAIIGVSAPATAHIITRKQTTSDSNGRYAKATEFAGLSAQVESMKNEIFRRLQRIEDKLDTE